LRGATLSPLGHVAGVGVLKSCLILGALRQSWSAT
jgi:hypothetical protein